MSISNIISSFLEMNIQSEEEVRSKFVVPLLEELGYPVKFRAEEFWVFGYGHGGKSEKKRADFIQFTSDDFDTHTSSSEEDINWVKEHSLLVFESKNITADIKKYKGQPTYYAACTRSPAYIISNGKTIEGYLVNSIGIDRCCFSCDVSDIPENWPQICELNYENIKKIKEEAKEKFETKYEELYLNYITEMNLRCEEKLKFGVERNFSAQDLENKKTNEHGKIIKIDYLLHKENLIITSEPGGGKSYLMWMFMENILHHSIDDLDRIPIILEGKYYGKTYHSIQEGIYDIFRRFVSNITVEYIDEQIQKGKYYILFDAVDEIEVGLDEFHYELVDIAQNTECQIILTSRTQNYNNELYLGFDYFKLDPLTDQQKRDFINNLSGLNHYFNFNQIPDRLTELLGLPLYLQMYVDAVRAENCKGVPKNLAALFELYVDKNLNRVRCNEYEKEWAKRILSQYAEYNYENEESSKEFFDIIEKTVTPENVEKFYDILWKSGLICQGEQGICFSHRTFMEFFYAYHLAQSNEDEIKFWLDKKSKSPKYDEIICLLTGILANRSKQNMVLDYLEGNNLHLYVKALKSRRNFSISEEQLDYSYANIYFKQMLKSYANLMETYFDKLKKFCDGYRNEEGILSISGNMDTNSGNISVLIDRRKDGNELNVTCSSDDGAILEDKNGNEFPITSFVCQYGNSHYRGYNLGLLQYGFDSSREIAADIVKNQILDLLKHNVFDDFLPVLLCEDIEQQLKRLQNKMGRREQNGNLTLYSNDINKVINAIENEDISPLEKYSLLEKCKKLLSFTENPIEYLNVPMDLVQGPHEGYGIDKYYSDAQLIKKIEKIIRLEQQALCKIMTFEIPFLSLTEKRYRVIGVIWRNNNEAGIQYIKVLCDINEDINPIILFSKLKADLSLETDDDFFKNQLILMGKSEKDIIGKGNAIFRNCYGNDIFHLRIYKYLKDKIEKIFRFDIL